VTLQINPQSSLLRLQNVIDGLTDERHRIVLGAALRHATLESEPVWDIDQIMATLVAEPAYHIWVNGTDLGPKGAAAVRAFYSEAVRARATLMEFDVERVIVDDRCAVVEGTMTHLCSGALVASLGMAGGNSDTELDPDAYYVVVYRNLTVMPVTEDGLIEGEDVYISGPSRVTELSNDELPEYVALPAHPPGAAEQANGRVALFPEDGRSPH
jgi:hypothetical protein